MKRSFHSHYSAAVFAASHVPVALLIVLVVIGWIALIAQSQSRNLEWLLFGSLCSATRNTAGYSWMQWSTHLQRTGLEGLSMTAAMMLPVSADALLRHATNATCTHRDSFYQSLLSWLIGFFCTWTIAWIALEIAHRMLMMQSMVAGPSGTLTRSLTAAAFAATGVFRWFRSVAVDRSAKTIESNAFSIGLQDAKHCVTWCGPLMLCTQLVDATSVLAMLVVTAVMALEKRAAGRMTSRLLGATLLTVALAIASGSVARPLLAAMLMLQPLFS